MVVRRADAAKAAATVPLRFHDELAGLGQVYDGEQLLADVEYRLFEVEEVNGSASATEPSADGPATASVVGERNVYGIVKWPRAEALDTYMGARLILRLQDRRVIEFAIAKVLPANSVLVQQLARVGVAPTPESRA